MSRGREGKRLVDSQNTNDFYVYEYYLTEVDEVFYVGKGKGRRAWTGTRNSECERVKRENDWGIRILQENMTEQDAGELEIAKILEYKESGISLTNIKPGGSGERVNEDGIAEAKYLLFLVKHNVLRMSQADISEMTGVYSVLTSMLSNEDDAYSHVARKVPDDIDEIILKYHVNSYTDEQKKAGHIKYVLELLDKGVIKMTQIQIAELFNTNPTNVSSIKKGKSYTQVPPIVPNSIGSILRDYDVNILTEQEVRIGTIRFILRLVDEGTLKITGRDLAKLLGVSEYVVTDVKRGSDEHKSRYEYPEVRPSAEVFAMLAPYFSIK